MSIKAKFIVFNAALTLLIVSGLGLFSILSAKKLLTDEAIQRAGDLAHALGESARLEGALKDESAMLATVQELVRQEGVLSAWLSDAGGKVIVHDDIRKVGDVVPVEREKWVRTGRGGGTVPYVEVGVPILSAKSEGEEFLFVQSETGEVGGPVLGFAQVRVSMEKDYAVIQRMAAMMSEVTALAVAIAMALVFFILNVLLSPLQILKLEVEAFGSGNLAARTRLTTNDEIADLSESFNRMADRLERTLEELRASKAATEELNDTLEARVAQRSRELERTQERMLQSEKMSAIGQLAAGVAHEINNPLGVILGFAQGVVQRIRPGDSFELPMKSIEREAVRCKNLVQDLLIFSRTDTNTADRAPLDINLAVEGAAMLIGAGAKMNSVEIKIELSPDRPRIAGNKNQIQQVIINLANNAVDAMPAGGTLRIATEVRKEDSLSWAVLSISDTGFGIPPEIQSRIFDPFFTTKPVGKGTGLGLALVFEIVQKHSGTIEVKSRPGHTEFCIKFPVHPA